MKEKISIRNRKTKRKKERAKTRFKLKIGKKYRFDDGSCNYVRKCISDDYGFINMMKKKKETISFMYVYRKKGEENEESGSKPSFISDLY